MERFTKYANGKTCCTYFGWSEECKRVQGHCCECKINDMVWDELKGYEDAEKDGFVQIMDCMGCEYSYDNWDKNPCINCIRNKTIQLSDCYKMSESFNKFIKSIEDVIN